MSDRRFRSQSLSPDDTAIYPFNEDGVYEYFCHLQSKTMCGAIPVGDTGFDEALPGEGETSST